MAITVSQKPSIQDTYKPDSQPLQSPKTKLDICYKKRRSYWRKSPVLKNYMDKKEMKQDFYFMTVN